MIENKGSVIMNTKRDVLVSKNNKAIHKNNQKCIKCGYCINACQSMDILNRCKNLEELKEVCINCGRCTLVCPVEAIREKYNYQKVLKILASKKKVKVVSIAPAVRVAFEEEFGGFSNENKEGILVGILKELGFDYVFDIASGADLVIVEEAKELQKIMNIYQCFLHVVQLL